MQTFIRKFINQMLIEDIRTFKLLATAAASYIGRFGQGIAVLVTIPIARQCLTPDLFGLWMMLSSLLSFLAFADLGVGNGILNIVTKCRALNDFDLLKKTLVSGYLITSFMGLIFLAIWFLWLRYSSEPTVIVGVIASENMSEVIEALNIFSVILFLNIPAGLILRIQLGMQQGYLNGLNQFIGAMFTLIAVPMTLNLGGGVPELIIATLGVQTLVNIVNTFVWFYHHNFFKNHNGIKLIDLSIFHNLLRTGALFFLLQLSVAFAFQSDSIVITQTLGQSEYGDFAVVQKLYLFISMLVSVAMMGLWPAFADAIIARNIKWVSIALKRGIFIALFLTILGTSVLTMGMPWVLSYWLKSSVQPSILLLISLSIWTIIDSTASISAALMNGANKLRAQLILALGMASLAFAMKWFLTPLLGVSGAVISTIIAYSIISVPGQIYIIKQILQSKE